LAERTSPSPKKPVAAAAATPTQISTNAIERRREEARRAETTARASHRVAVRKIDSIEESSVPAKASDYFAPVATEAETILRLRR
jgi:hypothetical protein